MERSSLKKLIIQIFDTFAKDNGFINRKNMYWYKISNGILISIGFDMDSTGYKARYFVQPLYEYSDCIVLTHGDVLIRHDAINCRKYLLYMSYDEEVIKSNLDNIKEYFSEEIISKLLKITDASSLITVAKTSELFFCADLMRLIAYSEAICKNTEKAIDCFKTYLKNVGNQSVYKECLHILEILEDCPEKALALLNDNIQRSIIAMNLKV